MVPFLNFFVSFALASPPILLVKPGESTRLDSDQWQSYRSQEITIQCQQELKCKISFEYVGKKYALTMPNGNNYAFYKDRNKALAAAGLLVSSKVCDRIELDMDNNEVIQ